MQLDEVNELHMCDGWQVSSVIIDDCHLNGMTHIVTIQN